MPAQEECKYLVIKFDDINKYLTMEQKRVLNDVIGTVRAGRMNEGKCDSPSYIMCNRDEPYAEDVLAFILKNETYKEAKDV